MAAVASRKRKNVYLKKVRDSLISTIFPTTVNILGEIQLMGRKRSDTTQLAGEKYFR